MPEVLLPVGKLVPVQEVAPVEDQVRAGFVLYGTGFGEAEMVTAGASTVDTTVTLKEVVLVSYLSAHCHGLV